jgi:hypothetical protein
MLNHNRRLFTITVALLAAVALWGVLLVGTAAAQSTPPPVPGQDWHYDMMGGHMGYGYRMQAGVPVTGTAPYQGHGMMGHGMMGHGMRYGMQAGVPVTGTAPYQGQGMMGFGCH